MGFGALAARRRGARCGARTPPSAPRRASATRRGATRWSCGGYDVELHPCEAEGYHLNLVAPEPKVFVAWRPAEDGLEPAMRPTA